jgi:hypothetical protein
MRKGLDLPSYTSIAATRALGYVSHTAFWGAIWTNILDDPKKGFAVGASLSIPWAIGGVAEYLKEKKKPYNQKTTVTSCLEDKICD